MKIIVLPGYSAHNLDWAEKVADSLGPNFMTIVHKWGHWQGGSFSLKREIEKILEEIGGEKISIIAKSVGTRVAMELIPKIINKIDKVILVGIPTKFESEPTRVLYRDNLFKLGGKSVLCIQNTRDPFSPFATVKKFINGVDPKITVVEKQRSDHEYPYFDEFRLFLSSKNPS